jgi:hypothetical protein
MESEKKDKYKLFGSTLKEAVKIRDAQYMGEVERRTESELLTIYIKKAKEKEKIDNGKQVASEYTEKAIASTIHSSQSVIHRMKIGERPLTDEDKQKLEKLLSLRPGSLDPATDQLRRGYHKSIMRDIFYVETDGEDYWEDDEEIEDNYYREMETRENERILKDQLGVIRRWFYNPEFSLENCFRLVEYMDAYQKIGNNCYEFFLCCFRLNKKTKEEMKQLMDKVNIPVGALIKSVSMMSSFECMINLEEDYINEQVKKDKIEIKEANTTSKNADLIVRNKYWEKIEEYCKVSSYGKIETLYNRFFYYVRMKKEDWEIMIRFMLMDWGGRSFENTMSDWQNMFCILAESLSNEDNEDGGKSVE